MFDLKKKPKPTTQITQIYMLSLQLNNKFYIFIHYMLYIFVIYFFHLQLIGGSIDDYLNPIENDLSLIKCYHRALQVNLLRPESIPHTIATHHVRNYLERNKN